MDANAIIAILTGVAGVTGGYVGGKRTGQSQAVSTAVEVVDLLQVQVSTLVAQNAEKDEKIAILEGKVELLEAMITQRAEVEAVHAEVKDVRGVVDRIAIKVGA